MKEKNEIDAAFSCPLPFACIEHDDHTHVIWSLSHFYTFYNFYQTQRNRPECSLVVLCSGKVNRANYTCTFVLCATSENCFLAGRASVSAHASSRSNERSSIYSVPDHNHSAMCERERERENRRRIIRVLQKLTAFWEIIFVDMFVSDPMESTRRVGQVTYADKRHCTTRSRVQVR